jgi:hypothetical protein
MGRFVPDRHDLEVRILQDKAERRGRAAAE